MINIFKSIDDVPNEWDRLCNNYFQKKEFLKHCETYNKCDQSYYCSFENDELDGGAVVYSININLLTFSILNYNKKIRIIGLPVSISSSSIIGNNIIIDNICLFEKKMLLCLNTEYKNERLTSGNTLPTMLFNNSFISIQEYLLKINRSFRRRYIQCHGKLKDVVVKEVSLNYFTQEMYSLYLNVFNNSKFKLEKLSFDFFKNLPSSFKLFTLSNKEKVIGWYIILGDDKTLYYFLGGIDYSLNKQYKTYFNILYLILDYGIINKYEMIDFGQTSEESKQYIGCKIKNKYMFVHHYNKICNKLLKLSKSIFFYNLKLKEVDIYKNNAC